MDKREMEFDGFNLRSWKSGDEHTLAENANNKKIWRNLRDVFPHPYTIKDAKQWIKTVSSELPVRNFAIVVDDIAVGGIGISPQTDVHRKSAVIGYWLGENYWNKGIMTQAVKAVTEYAFETFDICRLYANVFQWNKASMKVLQKAGYKREARLRKSVTKNGSTCDQIIYSVVRETRDARSET